MVSHGWSEVMNKKVNFKALEVAACIGAPSVNDNVQFLRVLGQILSIPVAVTL